MMSGAPPAFIASRRVASAINSICAVRDCRLRQSDSYSFLNIHLGASFPLYDLLLRFTDNGHHSDDPYIVLVTRGSDPCSLPRYGTARHRLILFYKLKMVWSLPHSLPCYIICTAHLSHRLLGQCVFFYSRDAHSVRNQSSRVL